MSIKTKPPSKEYDSGYDRIFRDPKDECTIDTIEGYCMYCEPTMLENIQLQKDLASEQQLSKDRFEACQAYIAKIKELQREIDLLNGDADYGN